ncbi:MAG TPA: hypothetical protein VMB91_05640 [Solirubrobacteraceae bacterium]|nr:hypothetical protein [Solirubrobacteraceae bacterium]
MKLVRPRLAVALVLVFAGGTAPARADIFGPIGLVSAGSLGGEGLQQAEYAHDSVICSDGSYLVFDGAVGGVSGIWRVNLATRAIQQVAGGDALLPSVSAEGRYVSFTSNQSEAELAEDTRGLDDEPPASASAGPPGPENVYVRDMERQPGEAEAFTVASAVDGGDEPLSYSGAGTELGSVAAAGSAISADGQEVAFVTTAPSNLAGPETPALQVAVRRVAARETILVSGEYDPASGQTSDRPVWAGGTGAVYGDRSKFPQRDPEYSKWIEQRPPGASISADGTTVAWMGVNVGLQAPTLSGEAPLTEYTEPLWRRISGPETSTERVTGGSDPSNPDCLGSGQTVLPEHPSPSDPCAGPFATHPEESEPANGDSGIWSARGEAKGTAGDFVPRLSRNGYTVAFLSRAEPLGLGEFFSQQREKGEPADIYVADMEPGLTRDGALTTLTRIGAPDIAEADEINEFALSESGQQVAFTTRRTEFRLAFPALVSAAAAEPGLQELFYVDLTDGTLTRVTRGYDGEPAEQPHGRKPREQEDAYFEQPTAGTSSPSFADEGALLAFSSTASNLVPGDGNGPPTVGSGIGQRDGSDAFVVDRESPVALATPQAVSPPPPGPDLAPVWALGVTALSRPDGSVVLYVRVPGPGTLATSALSQIVVHPATKKHARRGHASKGHTAGASVVSRTVASEHQAVGAPEGELLTIVLRPQKQYAGLTETAHGLSSAVTVSFQAPGHAPLTQTLQVSFARPVPKPHTRPAKASRHKSSRHGRRGR